MRAVTSAQERPREGAAFEQQLVERATSSTISSGAVESSRIAANKADFRIQLLDESRRDTVGAGDDRPHVIEAQRRAPRVHLDEPPPLLGAGSVDRDGEVDPAGSSRQRGLEQVGAVVVNRKTTSASSSTPSISCSSWNKSGPPPP